MAMTITPHDDTEFETSGRRRKITKFALAGVAVLGVGAALTSAAWTDNVWFAGEASTGTLDLRGSTDGIAWEEGNPQGSAITIDSTELDKVGPNISDTTTIYVKNTGSLPVFLESTTYTAVGPLFNLAGPKPATVGLGTWTELGGDGVLLKDEEASMVVTVTGGDWEGNEYQGRLGTLTINVQGTSDIPVTP